MCEYMCVHIDNVLAIIKYLVAIPLIEWFIYLVLGQLTMPFFPG